MSPPGRISERKGDEIVVAGKMVHTGTRVVTWMDPGGYDAYRVERRFSPIEEAGWRSSQEKLSSPNRFDLRRSRLTPEQIEKVRGGGWDLPALQEVVDQFVIHYDVAGTSRTCFKVLHDMRSLSVHFLLDVDGTIYQTLDLKERARHASSANDRSVGIEIANMGAYRVNEKNPFDDWYGKDAKGRTIVTIPPRYGTNVLRNADYKGRPARREMVIGDIQGSTLRQYDFTPEQYRALAHLTAALCTVFPKIQCEVPRDASGKVIDHKLPDQDLENWQGLVGHYHITTSKVDPGPAFQWDYVLSKARSLMKGPASQRGAEVQRRTAVKLQVDN